MRKKQPGQLYEVCVSMVEGAREGVCAGRSVAAAHVLADTAADDDAATLATWRPGAAIRYRSMLTRCVTQPIE